MADTPAAHHTEEAVHRRGSSVLSSDQQSALERHLKQRTAHHDMEAKGERVAPRLAGVRHQLEKAITRDRLAHMLEGRPGLGDLTGHNILRHDAGHSSSRIQAVARQLEHHMTTDRVAHLLEKRADADDLLHHNILLGGPDARIAPALQGTTRSLERNLAKSNLYHALARRPSLAELQRRGVYVDPARGADPYEATYRERKTESKVAYDAYQRRSKNFHLTRMLLKMVATMAEAGEITLQQKGALKDLIVDQDKNILAVAEAYDADNDINEFKENLLVLVSGRR